MWAPLGGGWSIVSTILFKFLQHAGYAFDFSVWRLVVDHQFLACVIDKNKSPVFSTQAPKQNHTPLPVIRFNSERSSTRPVRSRAYASFTCFSVLSRYKLSSRLFVGSTEHPVIPFGWMTKALPTSTTCPNWMNSPRKLSKSWKLARTVFGKYCVRWDKQGSLDWTDYAFM